MVAALPVQFITDFGDQAVILPLLATVTVALFAMGWPRAAWVWALTICCVLTVVLCLKLAFAACAGAVMMTGIRSPSGHTALAAAAYGGLIGLLGRRTGPGISRFVLTAALIAILVGLSRVMLGAHTVPDVVLGGVIGTIGAVVLIRSVDPPPPSQGSTRLAAAALGVLIVFHGTHLEAEETITRAARAYVWPLTLCRPG